MQHSSKPLSRRRILQTGSLLSLGMGLTRVVGLLVTSYFSGSGTVRGQSFLDKSVDHAALPKVPQEFQITLLAREPLLRQPCLMALSMQEPVATGTTTLRFASECRLKTSNGEPLCMLTNQFTLAARPNGWLLEWSAEFRADQNDFSFGDQEEMGFGARVATPFTENNGGLLRSSTGKRTATETWGQPAGLCDYSGSGERAGGILLMASPGNFREGWWHNRDYGVFVANPFGREAMKQGGRSTVTVAKGEALKLTFGALIHDHREFDPQSEFKTFEEIQTVDFMIPTDQQAPHLDSST